MKVKIEENGEKFISMAKDEFDKKYVVGCLYKYEFYGKPDSEVIIKIYGTVPDMKHCVINKPKTRGDK